MDQNSGQLDTAVVADSPHPSGGPLGRREGQSDNEPGARRAPIARPAGRNARIELINTVLRTIKLI
jgi:hypothetical protein